MSNLRMSSLIVLVIIIGSIAASGVTLILSRRMFSHIAINPESLRALIPSERERATGATVSLGEVYDHLVMMTVPRSLAVRVAITDATRTGFSVTKDGLILVPGIVKDVSRLVGASFDRRPFQLKIAPPRITIKPFSSMPITLLQAYRSDRHDVALKPIPFVPFETVESGQLVVSFNERGLPQFNHVVKNFHRTNPYEARSSDTVPSMIALDAVLSAGVPVFDAAGKGLVGIVGDDTLLVPAEAISIFLERYLEKGPQDAPSLGITFLDLSQFVPLADERQTRGLLITSSGKSPAVAVNSAAASAGLREGDILTMFDGQRLEGTLPFELMLQRYLPGTEVEIEFVRAGVTQKVKVVLGGKK